MLQRFPMALCSPSIAADARLLHIEAQLCEALHHLNKRARPVSAVNCNDGAVVICFIVHCHLHSQHSISQHSFCYTATAGNTCCFVIRDHVLDRLRRDVRVAGQHGRVPSC